MGFAGESIGCPYYALCKYFNVHTGALVRHALIIPE